jgi:stearoyl-CoA desaturase (delta-9 desaturase)
MFAITGFYHRYFSHRAFKTSRLVQFVFALIGCSSVQRGPLWWAAHHRHHHAASDTESDIHSPVARSFIWSHMGWITSSKNLTTDYKRIPDFAKYPELVWINRFDWLMPALLFVSLYAAGEYLRCDNPALGTSGLQLVAWGFFVSTTLLFHATCSINSIAHLIGYRRFHTNDHSRNNPVLAVLTFGEGWHNNHHQFSHCARQGFAWWEIDITYGLLLVLSALGLVRDLKPVPALLKASGSTSTGLREEEEASSVSIAQALPSNFYERFQAAKSEAKEMRS